ncbi:hypothetical protein [Melaminivora sp.]
MHEDKIYLFSEYGYSQWRPAGGCRQYKPEKAVDMVQGLYAPEEHRLER